MVQSSIVVPPSTRKRSIDGTDTPSEEVKRPRVEDSEVQQKRNRRLFGTLLGTLNKFKDETEKMSDIDKKRQAINEKLQEKLEAEKRQMAEISQARKEEKMRLQEEAAKLVQAKLEKEKKLAQDKMELAKLIENERLANFLKTTSATPTLYYLPEKLTEEMEKTIKEQKEKALEARKEFEARMHYQESSQKGRNESDDEEDSNGRRGGRRSKEDEEDD